MKLISQFYYGTNKFYPQHLRHCDVNRVKLASSSSF